MKMIGFFENISCYLIRSPSVVLYTSINDGVSGVSFL